MSFEILLEALDDACLARLTRGTASRTATKQKRFELIRRDFRSDPMALLGALDSPELLALARSFLQDSGALRGIRRRSREEVKQLVVEAAAAQASPKKVATREPSPNQPDLDELRVIDARDNEDLQDALVERTGFSRRKVRSRLQREHGRTRLRNAFSDAWDQASQTPDPNPASPITHPFPTEPRVVAVQPSGGLVRGRVVRDRYVLRRKLGEGGFGEVWEAVDQHMPDAAVVLKFSRDNDPERTLRREASAALKLHHPNICRYFHVDEDVLVGRAFIVMENAGRSVAERLEVGETFTPEASLALVETVAEALDHAHDRKLFHLDINPGNILLDEDGHIRVSDFGIASRAAQGTGRGGELTLSAQEVRGWSREYSAPEIFVGMAKRQSDQYSLARVLCAMLAGRVRGIPTPPPQFRQLSPAQNEAIAKALSLDPSNRFGSCAEFARALQQGARRSRSRSDTVRDLPSRLDALLERVEVELRRLGSRASSAPLSTEHVGGGVRLVTELEAFLRAVTEYICTREGLDPEAELSAMSGGRLKYATAGAGQLVRLVQRLGKRPSASDPMVRAICADARRGDASAIDKVAKVRNSLAHPRDEEISVRMQQSVVQDLARVLQKQRDAFLVAE